MRVQDRIAARRSSAQQVIKREAVRSQSSGLVYDVPRWNRYLYKRERSSNKGLRESEQEGRGRNERFPDFQTELFSRLYKPSTAKLETPAQGSEWAQQLNEAAEQVPEFSQLQQQCKGDEMWSGMATVSLGKSLAASMQPQETNEDIEKLSDRLDGLQDLIDKGVPGLQDKLTDAADRLAKAQAAAKGLAEGLDPGTIRQAVRKACAAASKEISEAEDAMEALSFGDSPGTPALLTNSEKKRQLASALTSSSMLKRIAEMAGRLRRVAMEKQRSKCDRSREEISDIEQGDDINRVLPSEIAKLAADDEDLEALFFASLLDKQALQYKLSGQEKQGRGPIVFCIDSSGSMKGSREEWSKAVALAMLEVARRQKRSFAVIHFSKIVERVDLFPKDESVDQEKLLSTLAFFSGGGTSFEEPLRRAMGVIALEQGGFKKADVVLITDGICSVGGFAAEFSAWKKDSEAKLITVLVNVTGSQFSVGEISDHVFTLPEILRDGSKFEDAAFSV